MRKITVEVQMEMLIEDVVGEEETFKAYPSGFGGGDGTEALVDYPISKKLVSHKLQETVEVLKHLRVNQEWDTRVHVTLKDADGELKHGVKHIMPKREVVSVD